MSGRVDNEEKPARDDVLKELEEVLAYEFVDQSLLARAMTHRSFANENDWVRRDNQRLEFLGDAVLGLVIAEALFVKDEQAPEGALSNQLSELVCEGALVEQAEALELGRFLRLGRGEELSGGRQKEGLLADAYEALLGAVYIDGGFGPARELILRRHAEAINTVGRGEGKRAAKSPGDFKSLLQRTVQGSRSVRPVYRIATTYGPPHDRRFVAEVLVDEEVLGRGEGTSKKTAEQAAAEQALARLTEGEGTSPAPSAEQDSLASEKDSR